MREDISILLVEDDPIDAMTVKRALKDLKVTNPLVIAANGVEALEFLRDGYRKPVIVLLDLNMPMMNGIEFLRIVKQDEALKNIPVVVLTTSIAKRDKIDSFNLGAAGYMVKPADYDHFVEVMRTFDLYWTLSEVPQGGDDQ